MRSGWIPWAHISYNFANPLENIQALFYPIPISAQSLNIFRKKAEFFRICVHTGIKPERCRNSWIFRNHLCCLTHFSLDFGDLYWNWNVCSHLSHLSTSFSWINKTLFLAWTLEYFHSNKASEVKHCELKWF